VIFETFHHLQLAGMFERALIVIDEGLRIVDVLFSINEVDDHSPLRKSSNFVDVTKCKSINNENS
jgi:hypothetical protein